MTNIHARSRKKKKKRKSLFEAHRAAAEKMKSFREKGRKDLAESTKKRILRELAEQNAKNKAQLASWGFYGTEAWRELRYRAFVKYGQTCMCCGSNRMPMHVDHIKPRSKYPELELDLDNLQILCADCNKGKGAWDETDWRKKS